MILLADLVTFALATLVLALSLGLNMLYLISRSLTQGHRAGIISLLGVLLGFLVHSTLAAVGLTALLLAVPMAYTTLKTGGVLYFLYLAYGAIRPSSGGLFDVKPLLPHSPGQLFRMGFLTNVLNPKIALFYVSFFPQFIRPEYGSVLTQSLLLALTQMLVSFTVNMFVIFTASRLSGCLATRPRWVQVQKWFTATLLTGLAVRMALDKGR